MNRPRIKRTTESVEMPNGDLLLLRPGADRDVRIDQPDEKDRSLLAAFDGEHTIEHLYEEFGEAEVEQLIAQLCELELVEDGADDDRVPTHERERLDRQLRYFSDIATAGGPTPSEAQDRLRSAVVAVLGVGGLGGRVAQELACIGVGEMWLVDGDEVELTNLNRQILYREEDIGRVKVEIAAKRLGAFNSSIRITAEAKKLGSVTEIEAVIADAHMVIDAIDWPAHDIERWCNEACFNLRIPYITMGHFPPIARVGPLYVPGQTGCYVCQEIEWREKHPDFDAITDALRAKTSPAGNLGPACGFIGGLVGMEVMHHLTGLAPPSLLGRSTIYDLRTMEANQTPVPHNPSCPICSSRPRRQRPPTRRSE